MRRVAGRSHGQGKGSDEVCGAGIISLLADQGVSRWLDGAEWQEPNPRRLARLVDDGLITGLALGPEPLTRSLARRAGRPAGPGQSARPVRPVSEAGPAAEALLAAEGRRACDVLLPVHERTGGRDGHVTLEAGPAADTATALRLARAVDRPNALVALPAGPEGLAVAADCLAEGIGVDLGPVLSPAHYGRAAAAWLDGLRRAHRAGRDLSAIRAVVSVPLAPVDAAFDERLRLSPSEAARMMRGEAALASARLVFHRHEQLLAGPDWRELATLGARPHRVRWTDTTDRTPGPPGTRYVDGLVVRGAITTLGPATLEAVAERGNPRGDAVTGRGRAAARVLDSLEILGAPYAPTTRELAARAARARAARWNALLMAVSGAPSY
ncbi:transaldolase family protein [Streptomyces roseoverticillatus]|uniref:transaldolase family protein n=1 Tax=Streptomyces roseoverticillatus TaxID=66429 RepID=UPI000998A3D7|nr:transaldolase family protein [Streptomyces roseoverticillatus]